MDNIITISGRIVDEDYEYIFKEKGTISVVFNKCIFKKKLSFPSLNQINSIKFNDCEIKNLNLFKCWPKENLHISIIISECIINQLTVGTNFSNVKVKSIDYLRISNSNIKNIDFSNIEFNDIIFNDVTSEQLFILTSNSLGKWKFLNLEINKIIIDLFEVNELLFNNIKVYEYFIIKRATIKNKLRLYNCRILGNSELTILEGNIYIHATIFEENLDCNFINNKNKEVGSINIKDSKFKRKGTFNTNKSILNKITIDCSDDLTGNITFFGFCISRGINLSGLNSEANISFISIKTNALCMLNFINQGIISFFFLEYYNIGEGCISIISSILKNTHMCSCNLSSFPIVGILDSSINDVVYINCKWFNPSIINCNLNKDSIFWKRQQDTFRELRRCAEQNSDKISAIQLKKHEIDAYRHTLIFEKNIQDYIVLWLNEISNSHGLYWFQGVCFTLLCCIFFFSIFSMSLDNFSFIGASRWKVLFFETAFWKGIADFFWLPNGLNGLNNLIEKDISIFSKIIGFISYFIGKISIAYGIFQTISAFRKHTKL